MVEFKIGTEFRFWSVEWAIKITLGGEFGALLFFFLFNLLFKFKEMKVIGEKEEKKIK